MLDGLDQTSGAGVHPAARLVCSGRTARLSGQAVGPLRAEHRGRERLGRLGLYRSLPMANRK
jgi:hypothetical protein